MFYILSGITDSDFLGFLREIGDYGPFLADELGNKVFLFPPRTESREQLNGVFSKYRARVEERPGTGESKV